MKAIIPAAGLGTRFLPGTKCTPKEMLPVLDKPVIQYVVEEALEPEEVDAAIIVTSPGKPELLNYFQPDRSLENLLRERGKNAYADAVAHAGGMPVDFRYQYEPKGLGHAIRSAADAVAGENFLVLLGDYVVPNRDICDKMLAVSKEHGGASVIAVAACSPEEVSRYGVIAGERVGSLEGAEGGAEAEPGAVWQISRPARAARSSSPTPWPVRSTARPCTPSSSTRCRATTLALPLVGWPLTPSWLQTTPALPMPSGTPSTSAAD